MTVMRMHIVMPMVLSVMLVAILSVISIMILRVMPIMMVINHSASVVFKDY